MPAFEQIRAQIADLIASGLLAPGSRLPPIRQLAADLDLAPGTVARAYRALDLAGLTRGRARSGTTVAPRPESPDARADERLNTAARDYARVVAALGLTRAQAVAALLRHLAAPPMP